MDRGGNYNNNYQLNQQYQNQGMPIGNQYYNQPYGENQGKMDLIALITSLVSILCCGITGIVSLILSIIVIADNSGKYPKKTKAIIALVISILVMPMMAVVVAISGGTSTKPVMPDVTGLEYYDARTEINNSSSYSLTINKEEEYSDTVEEGLVIRSTPDIGEELTSDTEITLYISKGKQILMPNIIGMTLENAKSELSQIGFEVYTVTEEYSDAEVGTVTWAEYETGDDLTDVYSKDIDVKVSKGTKEQEIQSLKENAQSVTYDDLIRYPYTYETTPIKITVSISDLEAQTFLGIQYDTAIWAYLGEELLILSDDRDIQEPALREGDTVTIYGYGKGTTTIDTKEKEYQGSLVFGFSYDKTVDSYEVPYISIQYVEF
jgi:hypothetical protein